MAVSVEPEGHKRDDYDQKSGQVNSSDVEGDVPRNENVQNQRRVRANVFLFSAKPVLMTNIAKLDLLGEWKTPSA
ncbi:hypothetical protein TYRP_020091 [Tyrophagus putrescentiae]|nr:hypothetical protein TYRP_020091 [Tyrophagus putrescentiae]